MSDIAALSVAHPWRRRNPLGRKQGAPATSHLKKCAVRFPHFLMLVGRYATLCLEAILASQPFRKRAGTDSYLGTPEHRTEEPDFGPEVSFWVAPRLALYHYLAPGGPEQSPFRRKVLHLDHIRWTQIISPLAHSGTRIPPDSLRRVP
jgi:hypothetical protein